ncbi:HNH endonuclease signature motif containing protein [Kutzneria albida]|uniref:HNH nuclease domain-containing protein n=1 Tax=Kutzneria albida DSM 43870 TaxID=1449976 RepID=W5WGQ7_9PSEU|nr:HNH endonuclease signature motif containing protein [Kutzneria albida]AHI00384.1 hypothetical protein KALB_7026 [Kutzneria albida DSM 43870]
MGQREIAERMLEAWQRLASVEFDLLCCAAEIDDPHEIALLLRIPLGRARRLQEQAAALDRLPVLAGLLRDGLLDLERFEVVRKRTENLDSEKARRVDARLADAAELNSRELKAEADRLICLVDPFGAEIRHVKAVKRSEVRYRSMPDGMAELTAYLDAVRGRQLFDQINADAETLDDDRSWGEKQADVVVDRMLGSGRPVTVCTDVTVSATTLLGLTSEPGYVAGVGPVEANTAREIASQGDWRKVLTDKVGMPIGVGRRRYRPPRALRDFVMVRDRVCQAPGCMRPVGECQIDHARGFASGGVTDERNLGPFCDVHHYLKTIGRYRFSRGADGVRRWVTPLGFEYETRAKAIAEPDPP